MWYQRTRVGAIRGLMSLNRVCKCSSVKAPLKVQSDSVDAPTKVQLRVSQCASKGAIISAGAQYLQAIQFLQDVRIDVIRIFELIK